MESIKTRVIVEYNNEPKLLRLKIDLKGEEMLRKILRKFDLDEEGWEDYDLILKSLECKAMKVKDLVHDDKLLLKPTVPQIDQREESDGNSLMNQEGEEIFKEGNGKSNSEDSIWTTASMDNWLNEESISDQTHSFEREMEESRTDSIQDQNEEKRITMEISNLDLKEWFDREELKKSLNVWANDKNIKLSLDSQERCNKNGTKVSVFNCSKKKSLGCKFSLEFRTTTDGSYSLHQFNNQHNHQISEYDSIAAITPEILKRIKFLKPVTLDCTALTKAINDEFGKNFHRKTIYYQAKKAIQEDLGVPNDDADNFVKMLEEEAKNNNGFYQALIKDNKLKNCCYMSKRMKEMINYFSDVLIIDTSHKINRFNLPLLDVVCIDNLGKSTTVFVGLMGDQTYQTFLWTLEKLKSQLSKTPKVIFTDEEEALTKGKFI